MTTESEARALTIAQLVDRFAALGAEFEDDRSPARQVRVSPRPPAADAFMQELGTVGRELQRRGDGEAMRPLFESASLPVRLLTALAMTGRAPELAAFSLIAPTTGLTDDQARDLIIRTTSTDLDPSDLSGLTADDLVARFVDYALRNFVATRFFNIWDNQPAIDISNRIIEEICDVLLALKAKEALARLLTFLDHPNVAVRTWAAKATLGVDEARALKVLQQLAASADICGQAEAKRALRKWADKGRVIYGLTEARPRAAPPA